MMIEDEDAFCVGCERLEKQLALAEAERDAARREAEHWKDLYEQLQQAFHAAPAELGGSG